MAERERKQERQEKRMARWIYEQVSRKEEEGSGEMGDAKQGREYETQITHTSSSPQPSTY
jgi:hypothetical protein